VIVAWLLGCAGGGQAAAPVPPASAAPAVSARTPPPELLPGPELEGLCDASAGIAVGDWLVVADDEHDRLMVYDRGGAFAQRIDLERLSPRFGDGESDLEGLAAVGDTVWLIASHDSGKGTERKPHRQRLAALHLRPTAQGVEATLSGPVATGLIDAALGTPGLGPVLSATAGFTSKDPRGLSIEGLAAGPGGGLLVGFRTPIVDNKALLMSVSDPAALSRGADPLIGPPIWLDLGGRGVRSIAAHAGGYRIVAGPAADGALALYDWDGSPGSAPVLLPVLLGGLRPEGLVRFDGGWWLLSDDGSRKIDGERCKELPRSARRARTARLVR